MNNLYMDGLISKLQEKHPGMSERKLREIVRQGCSAIHDAVINRKDVHLHYDEQSVRFTVFKKNLKAVKIHYERKAARQK